MLFKTPHTVKEMAHSHATVLRCQKIAKVIFSAMALISVIDLTSSKH